ncbi:acetolactate synthase large subunit [Anaerospora hongkongensis]|uniref:Acetolactate synthase n=1 Tax=Anaerospora hongkongensis TaxID=244830 RepID=A0A4R1PKJ1_9FIRM|nr:biosynthetic-type acetolactate synthase large subunit [Anaerospora hongkongensis]TCL31583.1 acetolactate synthase large subunit [Anaerospora hongkongensis]
MKITGAQVIIKCLLEQNVDTVFGYPGGAILPLYDALYDGPIRHILPVHEQGAAHMADGYARATGKVGVCIATSGPGATNLVTGLATAFMDSVPVVAITGQVSTSLIGRDAFQEVDITGITMPITKHNFLVKDIKKLPEVIRQAFRIAKFGRPGPVLIDIPRDVQTAELEYSCQVVPNPTEWNPMPTIHRLIGEAAQVISNAKRPVIHIGGGVIAAEVHNEVQSLAENCSIPIVSSLMGLGGVAHTHTCFLGLTGMHGHRIANAAVHNADLIIVVGSRFSDRVTGDRARYAADKKFIHIDVDPAEIDKNVAVQIGLTGDLKKILTMVNAAVRQGDTSAWWNIIRQWQVDFANEEKKHQPLLSEWAMKHISQKTAGLPVVFVTDVGQHQMWAAQNLAIENPRSWITSGGLGTMGFGLPAAIGAQLACPEKRVIHLCGDGGFKMTGAELFTVATHSLPIITIIIDNSCLGMVRQLQKVYYPDRYSQSMIPEMDFVTFAKAFNIEGTVVNTKRAFIKAFDKASTETKPYVIVIKIDREDMVNPMIAPGATLDEYVSLNDK